jgi:hypothetical protein
MKKVLSFVLLGILAVIVTGGFLVFTRYAKNPPQIFPYPYSFESSSAAIKLDAPILITGDRMGAYFAKFSTELSSTISSNLDNSIKIQSLAKEGMGLHRTLHQLMALTQWPQIVIYQGASEEFQETKYILSEKKIFTDNIKLFNDDRIESLIMLYPWMARFIYEPMMRMKLPEVPQLNQDISEAEYLSKVETELLLFEQQLIQLTSIAKDRSSLLILTTTPINLDIAPKKICEFTSNLDIEKEIMDLREFLKNNDPKSAYQRSSKAVKLYSANAQLFYIHGQIAKRLGLTQEAKSALLEASAFDCEPWRATEVFNSIIRKVAQEQNVILFDFAKLVEKDFTLNTTFFDEVYPQNLYYDKAMEQLGLVIKRILKL